MSDFDWAGMDDAVGEMRAMRNADGTPRFSDDDIGAALHKKGLGPAIKAAQAEDGSFPSFVVGKNLSQFLTEGKTAAAGTGAYGAGNPGDQGPNLPETISGRRGRELDARLPPLPVAGDREYPDGDFKPLMGRIKAGRERDLRMKNDAANMPWSTAIGRRAGQGVTLFHGDEATAALGAGATSGPEYERARDEERWQNEVASEKLGMADVPLTAASSVPTAMLMAPVLAAGGVGAGPAMAARTAGGALLRGGAGAAIEGGIAGAGASEAETPMGVAKDALSSAALGGAVGGVASAAGRGLDRAFASAPRRASLTAVADALEGAPRGVRDEFFEAAGDAETAGNWVTSHKISKNPDAAAATSKKILEDASRVVTPIYDEITKGLGNVPREQLADAFEKSGRNAAVDPVRQQLANEKVSAFGDDAWRANNRTDSARAGLPPLPVGKPPTFGPAADDAITDRMLRSQATRMQALAEPSFGQPRNVQQSGYDTMARTYKDVLNDRVGEAASRGTIPKSSAEQISSANFESEMASRMADIQRHRLGQFTAKPPISRGWLTTLGGAGLLQGEPSLAAAVIAREAYPRIAGGVGRGMANLERAASDSIVDQAGRRIGRGAAVPPGSRVLRQANPRAKIARDAITGAMPSAARGMTRAAPLVDTSDSDTLMRRVQSGQDDDRDALLMELFKKGKP